MQPTSPARVLCVDDFPAAVDTIRDALAPLGVRFDSVTNANDFIGCLLDAENQRCSYDIIVLDMYLPYDATDLAATEQKPLGLKIFEMDACYRILPVTAHVIVLTGHESFAECVKCVSAGAVDYIPKEQCGVNGYQLLRDRCEEILNASATKPDELDEWLDKYWHELQTRFAGQFIAVVNCMYADEAIQSAGMRFDDKVILAGDYHSLRMQVLRHPVLRWEMPRMINIPSESGAS